MEEGCLYAILIMMAIIAVLALAFYVLLGIGLGLAYIGMSVIILLDFIASSFTWIGVSSPVTGWFLLGGMIGAAIGLAKGLKLVGRRSDAWKVYGGAAFSVVLLALGSFAAYPPGSSAEPNPNSNSSAPVRSSARTANQSTPRTNMNTGAATSARAAQPSEQVMVGGANEQFVVQVTGGTIYPTSIVLNVRQTSVNYTGSWISWQNVIGASYLTDPNGNRYYPDLSRSAGWADGTIRPGSYRQGSIVFNGSIPANARQLTLHFAYIPPAHGFARVSFATR